MKPPTIAASLHASDGKHTLNVLHTHFGEVLTHRHWDLHAIERDGFDHACQQVGNMLLRLLAEAQPAEFGRYLLLVPPPTLRMRNILLLLITKAMQSDAGSIPHYVDIIDTLLARHGTEPDLGTIPSNWKTIRWSLTNYPHLLAPAPNTDAEPPELLA